MARMRLDCDAGRSGVWRLAAVLLVGTVLGGLAGCTPQTVVRITLDLDSYVAPEQRAASAVVPTLQPLVVYLLPGLQVDDVDAGPDEIMAGGAEVTLPSTEQYAGAAPAVAFNVEAVVANEDEIDDAPGVEIAVVVGAGDAANIYNEGVSIVTESFSALSAGTTGTYAIRASLGPESEAYTLLLSGSFRVGIMIRLQANPSAPIRVRVRLAAAEATLEFVPFGLLSSGGVF